MILEKEKHTMLDRLEELLNDLFDLRNALENAMESKSWDGVYSVYEELGGDMVFDFEENSSDVEDKLAYIEDMIIQLKGSKKIEKKTAKKAVKKKRVKKKVNEFSVKDEKKKSGPVKGSGKNLFNYDDFAAEAEKENGFDKIDDSVKSNKRKSRPKYKTKSVRCLECSKMKNVLPELLVARDIGSFVCDDCLIKRR